MPAFYVQNDFMYQGLQQLVDYFGRMWVEGQKGLLNLNVLCEDWNELKVLFCLAFFPFFLIQDCSMNKEKKNPYWVWELKQEVKTTPLTIFFWLPKFQLFISQFWLNYWKILTFYLKIFIFHLTAMSSNIWLFLPKIVVYAKTLTFFFLINSTFWPNILSFYCKIWLNTGQRSTQQRSRSLRAFPF